jgi:hypothetical protein
MDEKEMQEFAPMDFSSLEVLGIDKTSVNALPILKIARAYRILDTDSRRLGYTTKFFELLGIDAPIKAMVKGWLETKDPSFMDAVIEYCHAKEIPILPEVVQHLNDAMKKRIEDGSSTRKAFKLRQKKFLFIEMAKLMHYGATLSRAAELAAYHSFLHHSAPFKASTLETQYPKHRNEYDKMMEVLFDKDIYEKKMSTEQGREDLAYIEQHYLDLINSDINIPEEVIGSRR